jgi:4-alpha-glucanotransferase
MAHRVGFCVPLSALWSTHSLGVGEFFDVLPLLPWMQAQGLRILQLLPLNDTGLENSPYSALSTCALNPLYLSLHALPEVERMPKLREALERWPKPAGFTIALSEVRARKLRWLEEYLRQRSTQLLAQPEVREFLDQHMEWLRPYAAFTWLKLHRKGSPFWEWGIDCEAAIHTTPPSWLERQGLIQYLCWSQLQEVRKQADSHQVQLMGDLPILCNRDSVDVWAYPELFDLSLSAGAPPDAYAPEGQVWGFPVFRMEGHIGSEFRWWKQRLKLASLAYPMLRIDHILGFFRIWAVPLGARATEGFFLPKDPKRWLPEGEAILRILQQSTSLELIGEDLGIRVPGLRETLDRLHIPGMSVQRWMRDWDGDESFWLPDQYPRLSLATLSTHDSSLTGQWWQEEVKDAKAFCAQMGSTYVAPLSTEQRKWLLHWIHGVNSELIVNLLQEFLACFPDLVPHELTDRRINVPGTVNTQNWTLRLCPSVEQIVSHQGLSHLLKSCAAAAGSR